MNKVITINLDGTAYQLEEDGYDALPTYLETAAARLQGNPDRDEILSDIEREIRVNADQWRHRWHSCWAEHAAHHPGMAFALPLLSLLHGAAKVLWICAFISLLATGALFGLALPANVPVWVAVLLLFIAYGILTCPLKAARHACYGGFGRPRWDWSFVILLDAVVWLAVVAALLWLAVHYFPELREAFRSIPSLAHQAAGDIRAWWKGK